MGKVHLTKVMYKKASQLQKDMRKKGLSITMAEAFGEVYSREKGYVSNQEALQKEISKIKRRLEQQGSTPNRRKGGFLYG